VTQGLYLTTRAFLANNRPALVGYMAAMMRGWKAAAAEPDAAVDLVLSEYGADLGLDRDQQTRQHALQLPLVQPDDSTRLFALEPDLLTGPMTQVAEAAGRHVPPLTDFADTSIVDDALSQIF